MVKYKRGAWLEEFFRIIVLIMIFVPLIIIAFLIKYYITRGLI